MMRAGWALDRQDNLIHCYLVRDGAATGQSLCRRSLCGATVGLAPTARSAPGRSCCSLCVAKNAEKTRQNNAVGRRGQCRRCGGSMHSDSDRYGHYSYCLQCGHHEDPLTGPPIELRSESGRQRGPRLRNNR